MTKDNKLTFLPIEHKTIEEKYQDIENRNKKIEQELVNIMTAWSNFKLELNAIEKKKKRIDFTVYTSCFLGIFICSVLVLILEWSA